MTALSRLHRFGTLTPEIEQRLQQVGIKELERWAENILDAKPLTTSSACIEKDHVLATGY